MAELTGNSEKKIIALYLPQFHTIPENDEWWGEGFTEWTNTQKATPLFKGHYQPKIPINKGYYNLSDVTVMEQQAELAKEYGVFGFCYYHYWFKGGKQLLEKPVENMLLDAKVDIPFCLCWANENWSRNWDGGNREILMEQDYGTRSDWEKHFQYFLRFFKDKRYITYQGKPLLWIYKPEQIVLLNEMVDYWQGRAEEEGFPGLVIVRQHPNSYLSQECDESRIDYTVKFQPAMFWAMASNIRNGKTLVKLVKNKIKKALTLMHWDVLIGMLQKKKTDLVPNEELDVYDYDEVWNKILNEQPYAEDLINGAFVAWDNTPRNVRGAVFHGSTPEKFGAYMAQLLNKDSALNLVVINAWNEWAEGAYLEPDEKYGYAYLEALKKVLDEINE